MHMVAQNVVGEISKVGNNLSEFMKLEEMCDLSNL